MAQVLALGALFYSLSARVHEIFHTFAFNSLQFDNVTSPCAVARLFLLGHSDSSDTKMSLTGQKDRLSRRNPKGITA